MNFQLSKTSRFPKVFSASWHFQLARFYGTSEHRRYHWDYESLFLEHLNFCEYFWYVIRGGIKAAIFTAVGASLSSPIAIFFAYSLSMLFYWQWMPLRDTGWDVLALIGFILITIVLVAVSLVLAATTLSWVKERTWSWLRTTELWRKLTNSEKPSPPPEPGFFTLAYRKFKDKTCVKITLAE